MKPEARLEKLLVAGVKARGGLCFKLWFVGRRGAPDRIVIHHGRIIFVEMKAPEGRLSKLQIRMRKLFSDHGVYVYVLWTEDQVRSFLENL